MEVFPDLHHKMSKKIAQLTKVIYHLNTKNEDHQLEIDAISANHQNEIQQILKDAASKISKFKDLVETKQQNVNQEAQMEKLNKKHEMEKANAIKEFQNFKTKAKDRESKIASDFQQKFEILKSEIERMNGKFLEKIQSLESLNQNLKNSLNSSQSSSSSDIESLKKKHEIHLADVIQTSNQKYQDMLIDQIKKCEAITKDYELKLLQLKSQMTDHFKIDLEKEIGQIRAQLNGDKQESLMTMKREYEEKLQLQRDDWINKLDKAIGDIKNKTIENDRIRNDYELSTADLNSKIALLREQLNNSSNGHERNMQMLLEELSDLKANKIDLTNKLSEANDEIVRLNTLISSKTSELMSLEQKISSLLAEVTALKGDLDNKSKTGSALESDLKARLATAEREATSLRNEINTIAMQLNSTREDFKKSEKNAALKCDEFEKLSTQTKSEIARLNKALQDALSANGQANDKSSSDLANLNKKFLLRESELKAELSSLEDKLKKSNELMKDRHATEINNLKSQLKETIDANNLKISQLQTERDKLVVSHKVELGEAKSAHRVAMDAQVDKHNVELSVLRQSIDSLEQQMQSISDIADSEKTQLKTEKSALESKNKALMKDLDSRKKEFEKSESVSNSLKTQIEALREELKATQKAFRDKMDASMGKLEEEWQTKLDATIAEYEKRLEDALNEQARKLEQTTTSLQAEHEAELLMLKNIIIDEQNKARAELLKAEQERSELEFAFEQMKKSHAKEINDLKAKHFDDLAQLDKMKKLENETNSKDLSKVFNDRERDLIARHKIEVDKLNALLEEMNIKHESAMKNYVATSTKQALDTLNSSLKDLEKKMLAEKQSELSQRDKLHAGTVSDMKLKYDDEINGLNNDITKLKQAAGISRSEIQSLNDSLSSERQMRQSREEAFVLERDQQAREHDFDLRKEKEFSERKIIENGERFNVEMQILRQEYMNEKGLFEGKLREAHNAYLNLENRWKSRESRPEDIARISQLEEEMVAKDELVARTKEEMLYFKREMLNREDNYNQKFNRNPVVGVMQVIKPKEEKGGDPKRSQSNGRPQPTASGSAGSNAGNTAGLGLGVGMGMGLGVGGLGGSGMTSQKKR